MPSSAATSTSTTLGVHFRQATPADLPALLRLLVDDAVAQARGSYAAEITPEVRQAFDEIERDPSNELWLGEREGDIVAMLQLTLIPGLSRGGMKRALVEAVRVRADLRGQRVGEALMRHVEQRAGGRLWADAADHRQAAARGAPFLRAARLRGEPPRHEEGAVTTRQFIRDSGRPGPAAGSRCGRCGAPFHCGIDDAGGCWCAQLPSLPRGAYAPGAACVCEPCLRAMLAVDGRPAGQRS